MDSAVKDEYVQNIQKQISKGCFKACSSDEKCMTQCFENYLIVFQNVFSSLKQIGYNRNSQIFNTVYGPNISEWERIVNFNDQKPDLDGTTQYWRERDLYNLEKDN